MQPVAGAVDDPDGLVLAVVGDDREHRSEDLLLADRAQRVHVGEDRRPDVVAGVQPVGPVGAAADQAAGAVLDAPADVVGDTCVRGGGDQGAEVGRRVARIAGHVPGHGFSGELYGLVLAIPRYQQSAPLQAGLAGVEEHLVDGGGHGRGQVGVVEDEARVLPAEFEVDALDGVGSERGDLAAGPGGTGQGDHVDQRVGDERGADGGAGADDHVEDAGRQIGLGYGLGEQSGVQRGDLARLVDDRAAGRERGQDLLHGEQQRGVPGVMHAATPAASRTTREWPTRSSKV